MIAIAAGVRVLVSAQPVDFRRGIDGLAALVQEHLKADVFGGDVYVFRCRRADRVKILVWDGSGLCLFQKRLEQGHFIWPPVREGVVRLSSAQLSMLLEGLDWSRVQAKSVPRPAAFC